MKHTLSSSIWISEIARLTSERTVSYISLASGRSPCTDYRNQDQNMPKVTNCHQEQLFILCSLYIIEALKLFPRKNNFSWIEISYLWETKSTSVNCGIKFLSTNDTNLWMNLYGFFMVGGLKWNKTTVILFIYTVIEWIIINKKVGSMLEGNKNRGNKRWKLQPILLGSF